MKEPRGGWWSKKRMTPVRRGDTYCAPFCGHGCTWQAYNTAKLMARALADRLGKGWSPRVWENLGWHYSAEHESASLTCREYSRSSYSVGLRPGSYWCEAHTPQAALKGCLRNIQEVVDRHAAILAAVKGGLK